LSFIVLILPLLRPEVAKTIPLRPLYPGLDLLTAEEGSPAGLVVGDAVEVEPAADEFNLRVTRDHPSQFVDVNPVLLCVDGRITYVPVYMVMFLEKGDAAPIEYKVDLGGLSNGNV